MKKILPTLLAVSILLTSCGGSEDTDDRRERRKTTTTTTVMPTSESSSAELGTETESNTVSAIEENPVTKIDPFEGLEVQFDGISPYVNVSFNNSKCPSEVQNYVNFTYDEEANIANGDMVTVKAEYNVADFENENIEFTADEKSYQVSGMPEYVQDISKIDTSILDEEIQEYMNAHYLDASGGFGMVNYIMGADVYDGSGFGKECVSSNVENTYLCMLKSNKLDPDEDNNFYYKVYNNTYLLTGGDIGDHNINVYACIYIKNIISYPDGTLKYDPDLGHNADKSKEVAYYEGISSKNDSYNISEIK